MRLLMRNREEKYDGEKQINKPKTLTKKISEMRVNGTVKTTNGGKKKAKRKEENGGICTV